MCPAVRLGQFKNIGKGFRYPLKARYFSQRLYSARSAIIGSNAGGAQGGHEAGDGGDVRQQLDDKSVDDGIEAVLAEEQAGVGRR